jgi:hypothetical protein
MKNKLFFILGIVFLLGLASAGNYVFENTSGTELVKIWGENGNFTVLGDIDFSGIIYGDGSGLININTSSLNLSAVNYWGKSGSELYYNEGNVGIGTDDPSKELELLNGSIWAYEEGGAEHIPLYLGMRADSPSPFSWIQTDDSDDSFTTHIDRWNSRFYWTRDNATGTVNVAKLTGNNNDGSIFYLYGNETDNTVKIQLNSEGDSYFNGGNVGIGTTSPSEKFHVNVVGDTVSGVFQTDQTTNFLDLIDTNSQKFQIGIHTDDFVIRDRTAGTGKGRFIIESGRDDTDMVIDSSGNVGIGTTSPSSLLTTGISSGTNEVNLSGIMYVNSTSGNVGIGTSDPGANLEIFNADNTNEYIKIADNAWGNDGRKSIGFYSGGTKTVSIDAYNDDDDWGLRFSGYNGGYNSDIVTIRGDGNVGIGTTTPNSKLQVDGQIYSDNFKTNSTNESVSIGDGSGPLSQFYTLVGRYAGHEASGSTLTAVGRNAGSSNSGDYVTTMGSLAGSGNTGDYVTATGYYAGQGNTGDMLTATGYYAGYSNSGFRGTMMGFHAGYDNSGTYLTTIGMYSGRDNEGNYSSGFGYEAIRNNTANNVIGIGYQAGKDNTVANQFIVQQANINSVPLIQGDFATGNVNISGRLGNLSNGTLAQDAVTLSQLQAVNVSAVADETDPLWTENSTLVPYLASANTFTNNNVFNGNFTVDSNTLFVDNTTNRVGIGTTSPGKALEVSGDIKFSDSSDFLMWADGHKIYNNRIYGGVNDYSFTYWDGDSEETYMHLESTSGNVGIGTTTPSSLFTTGMSSGTNEVNLSGVMYVNSTSGNVGIGTGSPSGLLHVYSSADTNIDFETDNELDFNLFGRNVFLNIRADAASRSAYAKFYNEGEAGWYLGKSDSDIAGDGIEFYLGRTEGGASPSLWVETSGYIGVNTTTPTNTFNVVGDGNFTGAVYSNGQQLGIGNVSGSGTTNYLTKWDATGNVVVDSSAIDDSGAFIIEI